MSHLLQKGEHTNITDYRLFFMNSQKSLFSKADNQFWSELGEYTDTSILSQKLMSIDSTED